MARPSLKFDSMNNNIANFNQFAYFTNKDTASAYSASLQDDCPCSINIIGISKRSVTIEYPLFSITAPHGMSDRLYNNFNPQAVFVFIKLHPSLSISTLTLSFQLGICHLNPLQLPLKVLVYLLSRNLHLSSAHTHF